LIDACIINRNFTGAADLFRRQYARDPGTKETLRETYNRLDDLFALHAEVGPLAGFANDLKQHRDQLTRPQILYSLSHMVRRHRLAAFALRQVAYAAGGLSQQRRAQVAEFLANHGWSDVAERELKAVISLDDAPTNAVALNAHFRLGMLAARRGDHASAGREQRLSLERMSKMAAILTITRGDRSMSGEEATRIVWAEVLWHELLDARARRDEAAELDRAVQLAERAPVPEEIVLDAVPLLKAKGYKQAAQKLFEPTYKELKASLAAAPDNAHRMNGVAWLCARCDEHLEEAVALADRAVKAQPDVAALLDTAAEAHFRVGDVEQAIKLESRALELQPNDKFMREQLERFKKGR
jgi:tetratricopeptide (TPR) repeat protein